MASKTAKKAIGKSAGKAAKKKTAKGKTDRPFLTDINTLRARARKHIERGAVTEGYQANRARHRDRLRAALQASLLHGGRNQRRRGRAGVPSARE
jgi:hypothetical protein